MHTFSLRVLDRPVCDHRRGSCERLVLPLLLFVALFSIYTLVYSGLTTSADELSILAASESLWARRTLATDQLAWAVWQHGWMAQGAPGRDGHIYSKKGPGMSLAILPLFALGRALPGLGAVRTALLFNPAVAAATAALLLILSRRLGCGDKAGLVLGLLVGLATIEWPYTKTVLQEPATGLALLAAAYLVMGRLGPGALTAAGVALGLAITMKLTNAVLALPLNVYVGYRLANSSGTRSARALRALLLLDIAPAIAVGWMLYCNWRHFGALLSSGYTGGERFTTPLIVGLTGLLFSAKKSLFLYSPPLLLLGPALPAAWRRMRAEVLLLLGMVLATLPLYATWYDWGGGLTWGPRFLVPSVPLLSALLLPWLQESIVTRRSLWRGAFAIVAAAGLTMQAIATLAPLPHALASGHWPIAAAISALREQPLDVAWPQVRSPLCWLLPGTLAISAVVTLALVTKALRTASGTPRLVTAGIALTLASLTAALLSAWAIGVDSRLAGGEDYAMLCTFLRRHVATGDAIIGDNHIYTQFFLDHGTGRASRYGFLRSEALRPEAQAILERLLVPGGDVWLVTDRPPDSSLRRPEEEWLDQHAFLAEEHDFSNYARLIRYHEPRPGSLARHDSGFVFDVGVALSSYKLSQAMSFHPGEDVSLILEWRALASPLQDLSVSVQLLSPGGALAWQRDTRPVNGFRPMSGWRTGEVTIDRYNITLPRALAPGKYELVVVLYDPVTMHRARLVAPENSPYPDMVQLGPIDIG